MPRTCPLLGIAFGAEPAVILPHIIETPLRGSTRRAKTSWVCVTSAPSAATTSCVRCGREVWPPVPVSVTPTWLTAEVTGPDLEGDLAGVGARVAVQRVDLGQVGEHAAVDGVEGAAGAGLLGGLEDQPDAAGEQALLAQPGQHQADARARSSCARRARRRGRRRAPSRRSRPRCRPGSAGRRGRRAGRPGPRLVVRRRRTGSRRTTRRCRSAAPWPPGRRTRGPRPPGRWCGARRCRPRGGRGGHGGWRSSRSCRSSTSATMRARRTWSSTGADIARSLSRAVGGPLDSGRP